jgi:hypothetical protein
VLDGKAVILRPDSVLVPRERFNCATSRRSRPKRIAKATLLELHPAHSVTQRGICFYLPQPDEYCFAQALHCRRLAKLAHDPGIEAMLALTATDFEKRANALIAQPIPPIGLKLVQS